ncbi:MAG: DUF115 domain-containing protein [Treponemataceae bacterium]|nr:DUF115 domain-containing protein [Treponemataceae bacterium]
MINEISPITPDLYLKNINAFKIRFPELFNMLEASLFPEQKPAPLPDHVSLKKTKNGSWTALYEGNLLHSLYNPEREADKLVAAAEGKDFSAGVFMGTGLGYTAVSFTQTFPNKTLIIIEPSIARLISAFYTVDWTPVFRHPSCVILTGASQPQIIAILEKNGMEDCFFFQTPAHELHEAQFFNELKCLVERNIQKHKINSRTLKTFSRLWFRNMCINIGKMAECPGITAFKGKASGIPACIIGAGPSLDRILPFLKELKKRCLLICVDTALRGCLRVGVQPHFVVLTDPQFWNARHLAGLSAPETILITDTAAYPSVFRFQCRSIHLCASFFPLGQYIEARTGSKGKLGTGGSVASTTWDFARYCGCRDVYVAGLDLGFPGGKTHTKGSTFEEKALTEAYRLKNAETTVSNALFGANTVIEKDYHGNPLKTDNRMKLYAWWFESRAAEHPDLHTSTLTPEGLRIPGIFQKDIKDVLEKAEREMQIKSFIDQGEEESLSIDKQERQEKLTKALSSLKEDLREMKYYAEKAALLCKTHCQTENEYKRISGSLSACDRALLKSKAAELASLLFPGKEELDSMKAGQKKESDNPYTESLRYSELIYTHILSSIEQWEKNLLK